MSKQVILANPRGFCAGVDRAIEIVEQALVAHGVPVYVRHEVVHNKYVVDDLRTRGAVFIEDLESVPRGSTVVFSAHGVSLEVRQEAEALGPLLPDQAIVFSTASPTASEALAALVKQVRQRVRVASAA